MSQGSISTGISTIFIFSYGLLKCEMDMGGAQQSSDKVNADVYRISFIQRRFVRYYSNAQLAVEDMPQREFAFMFYNRNGMSRHISFTPEALKKYVVEHVPAHIYYSSALYQKPDAKTMDEKGWNGADLIFDLDADHIPGSEKMSYAEMLEKVKEEFKKLVDEFLLGDFGFDENDVKIVFSGGRGYHAHITKDCVRKLGTQERREIVDYISGTGLFGETNIEDLREKSLQLLFETTAYSPKKMNTREKEEREEYKKYKTYKYAFRLPPENATGWKKRIRDAILHQLTIWSQMEREKVLKELVQDKKIGAYANRIYDELFVQGKVEKIMNTGTLSVFSDERLLTYFIKSVLAKKMIVLGKGETDEPVTSDIKRLIRLPNSLHGKTGFVVVEMNRSTLDAFDPLRDAICPSFSDTPVKVEITKPVKIKLKNEHFALEPGTTELPEYAAMFMLCSARANLVHGSNYT
jgi:DNA primase small subunit